MTKKKIFAISGSTRKGSSNEAILKAIAEEFKAILEIDVYNEIDRLPHFNPDLDNDNVTSVVKDLRERIQRADGVLICTPEYVFSLPGSLKNAIEWNVSTTLFSNKAVAFIVAAASGEKAFQSLGLILTTIESRIAAGSKLLIKGAKAKVGTDGAMKDSETFEKIKKLVISLIQSIDEIDPQPTKYSSL